MLAAQLADPSVTPEVRTAVQVALDALAAAGWQLREITAPWLDDLPRWERALSAIVAREAWEVHRSRDTSRYAAGTRAVLDFGRSVTAEQYASAQAERAELAAAVDASLDGVDGLVGTDGRLLRAGAGPAVRRWRRQR